jgi:hypothetical protein
MVGHDHDNVATTVDHLIQGELQGGKRVKESSAVTIRPCPLSWIQDWSITYIENLTWLRL